MKRLTVRCLATFAAAELILESAAPFIAQLKCLKRCDIAQALACDTKTATPPKLLRESPSSQVFRYQEGKLPAIPSLEDRNKPNTQS